MATDELPLYTSFEDEISRCVLGEQNSDEPLNYGEKLCSNDITAHFFCLVNNSKSLNVICCFRVSVISIELNEFLLSAS